MNKLAVDQETNDVLVNAGYSLPRIIVPKRLSQPTDQKSPGVKVDYEILAKGIVDAEVSAPITCGLKNIHLGTPKPDDFSIEIRGSHSHIYLPVSQSKKNALEKLRDTNSMFWLGVIASDLALAGSEKEIRSHQRPRMFKYGAYTLAGFGAFVATPVIATDGVANLLDKIAPVSMLASLIATAYGGVRLLDTLEKVPEDDALITEPRIYPTRTLTREAARLARNYPVFDYVTHT